MHLQDAPAPRGKADHAAHRHSSSPAGLFLELFLSVSLMEPVQTRAVHLVSLWVLLFTLQCQYQPFLRQVQLKVAMDLIK